MNVGHDRVRIQVRRSTSPWSWRAGARMAMLSLLLALGACTTKYVAPSAGPLADVTVTGDGSVREASVVLMDNPECKSPQMLGRFGSKSTASLLAPAPLAFVATSIPAGRPLLFRLGMADTARVGGATEVTTCNVVVGFTPMAGRHYELEFGRTPQGCKVVGADITDGRRLPLQLTRRTDKQCS